MLRIISLIQLLSVVWSSTFIDFSGSGFNDEIDNIQDMEEDEACVQVVNSSFTPSVFEKKGGNPVLSARCASGCIGYFPNNSIDSCVIGCIKSEMNTTHCQTFCEGDCVASITETDNSFKCNTQACLTGCMIVAHSMNNDSNVLKAPSIDDLKFHFIPSNYTPGLYLDSNTASAADDNINPATTNSSIIVIRLMESDNLNSTTYYLIQTASSLDDVIELDYLSCTTVFVSYALVNKYGISDYSDEERIFIRGVAAVDPLDMDDVSYSLSYDSRKGFFGHYKIHLSWFNPSDIEAIKSFSVILTNFVTTNNNCQSENFTNISPAYFNDTTRFDVFAKHPTGPPIGGCIYNLKIVTIPKYSHQVPTVVSNGKKYVNIPSEVMLPMNELTCTRHLSSTGVFDVLIKLHLNEYIASENVLDSVQILPKLVETDASTNEIIDQSAFPLFSHTIKSSNQTLQFRSTGYDLKSSATFTYEFIVYLHWKKDILVTGLTTLEYYCSISALSPRPTIISNITLVQSDVSRIQLDRKIGINVHWNIPQMNGVFSKYQLCLLETVMTKEEENPATSGVHCKEVEEEIQKTYSADWNLFYSDNIHCLHFQMRAFNAFLPGKWSDPLLVSIDNECFNHSVVDEPSHDVYSSVTTAQSKISLNSMSISYNGNNQSTTEDPTAAKSRNSSVFTGTAIGISFLILTIIVLFSIISLHWFLRRRKRRLEFVDENVLKDVFQVVNPAGIQLTFDLLFDEWEIPSSQVIMESVLGQGAFGEVFKGIIAEPIPNSRMKNTLKQCYDNYVAIKILKTSASGSEKTDFLKEIEIMKKISEGYNPHIVNMIGCVTAQEPLCLVTEFIKHGDLLTYLRLNRKMVIDSLKNPYPDLKELNSVDLVSFGYQIAAGMEFLGSNGIVHRDLACRNILVGDGKSLKISDFGMSRFIGDKDDDVYVKTTSGRLPLKWMAIESIVDRQFTFASDVWSFGITLWEIATLGGFPYPTIENEFLLHKLRQGYRMERPENCSSDVYQIMMDCWSENAKQRPKFSKLRGQFDDMISAQNANAYIDLQTDETNPIYKSSDENSSCSQDEEIPSTSFIKRMGNALSPSRRNRSSLSPSNSIFSSKKSIDNDYSAKFLQVTNPWDRNNSETSSRMSSYSSIPTVDCAGEHQRQQRPMSLLMWATEDKGNLYVDEPAVVNGSNDNNAAVRSIVINVSSSSPSSPVKNI